MMIFIRLSDEALMKTRDDEEWIDHAKGVLKAELKRRNLTYRDLADLLSKAGYPENERNLTNKISRGSFTAAFLLQCLRVIGCESVDLRHLPQPIAA
jgi:hypothetical protein